MAEDARAAQIERMAAQLVAFRDALRRIAIKGHVRAGPRGGWLPNGHSCAVCKSEWPPNHPERHAATCLLAPVDLGLPPRPASEEPRKNLGKVPRWSGQ